MTLGGGGVLLVVGPWLLQNPETRCHHTDILDQRCEGWDVVGRGDGRDSVMKKESPFPRLFYKVPLVADETRRVASGAVPDYQLQGENLAQRLQHFLREPTATCRKLIRVGGRSCLGAYDGSKVSEGKLSE